MSALHMSYEDGQYFLQPPRDPDYDMAMALDIRPPAFVGRPILPDQFPEGFAPLEADYPMAYDPAGSFELHYPGGLALYDLPLGDMHHPAPRRPVSPELLFPRANAAWLEASTSAHGGPFLRGAPPPFAPEALAQPSMFAPFPEPHAAQPHPAEATDAPPPPPPSWAMSGSLDPATGIYQTAPEHPRVRTQQACEKCRGRKAKCSGERPCQRCRNRGLQCEYAPERKMRGPNKVKRKGAPHDAKSGRRASITSSVASTSSEDEPAHAHGSPPAPFTTAPRQFTMKFDVPSPAASGPPSGAPSPRAHARPPPISLAGTSLFDQPPVPLPQDVTPFSFDVHSPAAGRRASLPSYLLESHLKRVAAAGHAGQSVYTPPRGLEVVETTPRPRSSPAYPMDTLGAALSLIPTSHSTCSSSGASMSTPITPLQFPVDGELMYPLDFASSSDFGADFGSFAHVPGAGDWLGHDVDATPTLGSGAQDKSFSSMNEFVNSSP